MLKKLDTTANVVVIVVGVLVSFAIIRGYFLPPSPAALAPAKGQKMPGIPGINWASHRSTLLLIMRKGCHYCEDSVPFYQRLAESAKGGDTVVVALFPDAQDVARQTLLSEGLPFSVVGGVSLASLQISGTPTIILVGQSGRVAGSWVGMLSPRQELEVLAAAETPNSGSGLDGENQRLGGAP
jgi:hypothetical protein